MVGTNSITRNLIIPNTRDPKHSHEVIVQANKNLGIIDVILPGKPEKPLTYNKEERSRYMKASAEYKSKRSYLLNLVQGRPITDSQAINLLGNALYTLLN